MLRLLFAAFLVLFGSPAGAATEPLKWAGVKCCGTDISVGNDGSVWLIGNNGKVYRYSGSTWDDRHGGRGRRIAVDPDGNPWITAKDKTIWRYDGKKWLKMPGRGSDIGIGANGSVWLIGNKGEVFKWTGKTWSKERASNSRHIAVDPEGNPWITAKDNSIWRHDGKKWQKLPGAGNDIGIGGDGSVWLAGTGTRPSRARSTCSTARRRM
ncbi:MAG: hypothetical protein OXR84_02530 [Magnetovibrio sp.]|nr:hypothetical protein [Magnetovibrio sp.]